MPHQKFDVAKLERLNDPARFEDLDPARACRPELHELGQHLRDITCTRPQVASDIGRLRGSQVATERLHPRPVRGCAGVLPASPPEDEVALASRLPGQLVGEATLADPGLATEEDQAPASRARLVQQGDELAKLAVPPDEFRSRRLFSHGAAPPGWGRAYGSDRHVG